MTPFESLSIADGPEAGLGTHDASEQVWQAVEAWAAGINTQGQLANREVVVERIDAAVFRHEDAIDQVCNGDFFAIVGSWATNDADGLSQLAGPGCALPDFPARAFTVERLESELTFVSNPTNANTTNAGWAAYHAREYPDAVASAATMMLEVPAVVADGQRTLEAATTQGYTFVYSPVISVDTDFTQDAQALIDSGARSLTWRNSGERLLRLLAAIDDLDPEFTLDFIDCGQACYSAEWLAAAGDLRHPVHVWLPTLPIEEADLESELTRYLFFMTQTHGDQVQLSAEGLAAWSAASLFEASVNLATGKGTPDYEASSLTPLGRGVGGTNNHGMGSKRHPRPRQPRHRHTFAVFRGPRAASWRVVAHPHRTARRVRLRDRESCAACQYRRHADGPDPDAGSRRGRTNSRGRPGIAPAALGRLLGELGRLERGQRGVVIGEQLGFLGGNAVERQPFSLGHDAIDM